MELEIRRLTPELIPDYIQFFDNTPHATGKEEHRCYCVWWTSCDCTGMDHSTVEKRRNLAAEFIRSGSIQGYLAYSGGKVVGWCNANTKADCYECFCWRRFMGEVRREEDAGRIKSVFCFAIAPEVRGQGVATALLQRVCEDAAKEGFIAVEAYPNREYISAAEDFMGPFGIYQKLGFKPYYSTTTKFVMRMGGQCPQPIAAAPH